MSSFWDEIYGQIHQHIILYSNYDLFLIDTLLFLKYKSYLYDVLSVEEQKRANGISNAQTRDLFIIRKGLVKYTISDYVNCKPEAIILYKDLNGKPYVPVDDLFFNISHSKNILAIAISRSAKVGVDVQYIKKSCNIDLLSKDVLSNTELSTYTASIKEDKVRFFFKVWVCKEACTKCIGMGLTMDFSSFSSLGNTICLNGKNYYIDCNDTNSEYVYAVVIET